MATMLINESALAHTYGWTKDANRDSPLVFLGLSTGGADIAMQITFSPAKARELAAALMLSAQDAEIEPQS